MEDGRAGGLSLLLAEIPSPFFFKNLPFTWVCSLSLHSLNALFENCPSVREAVSRIQKQMCSHSDIKMTCAEFKTLTHTNTHAITQEFVHMFDGFNSTPNKGALPAILPLHPVLDMVQRVRETRTAETLLSV